MIQQSKFSAPQNYINKFFFFLNMGLKTSKFTTVRMDATEFLPKVQRYLNAAEVYLKSNNLKKAEREIGFAEGGIRVLMRDHEQELEGNEKAALTVLLEQLAAFKMMLGKKGLPALQAELRSLHTIAENTLG